MGEHISLTVNGARRELDVEPRRLLVQALRENLDHARRAIEAALAQPA